VDWDLVLLAAFVIFIAGALALDLGVFHRTAHVVRAREALGWSIVWIVLAIVFGIGVILVKGTDPGVAYFTGYLIEKSLSVDNVFVFSLVFAAFAVPREYQHRVLFWGVFGALVMRLVMILAGAALIDEYEWILYLFGGFLIFTGIRMALANDDARHPEDNVLVRIARRRLRVTSGYEGQRFFTRMDVGGRLVLAVTPLFLVLLTVELSDLVFAVDSIPAIFAVTTDPFIVFTSNAFAILGLRALYFLFAEARERFEYLKYGLAAVLVFVGAKMLALMVGVKIDPLISLAVIAAILGVSLAWSLAKTRRTGGPGGDPGREEAVEGTAEGTAGAPVGPPGTDAAQA
jgi:tellurite resistance protein TerC